MKNQAHFFFPCLLPFITATVPFIFCTFFFFYLLTKLACRINAVLRYCLSFRKTDNAASHFLSKHTTLSWVSNNEQPEACYFAVIVIQSIVLVQNVGSLKELAIYCNVRIYEHPYWLKKYPR